MKIFFDEHRLTLQALIRHNVEFMLVGGFAVNYYGYNRTTGDMDLWINPDNANKELLLAALSELGFDEEGTSILRSWDFTQPHKFYIGDGERPDRTEFMTHISGVQYVDAKRNMIIVDIDGLGLPIIHLDTLIQNKESTGRLKDLSDVEYLKKVIELRK